MRFSAAVDFTRKVIINSLSLCEMSYKVLYKRAKRLQTIIHALFSSYAFQRHAGDQRAIRRVLATFTFTAISIGTYCLTLPFRMYLLVQIFKRLWWAGDTRTYAESFIERPLTVTCTRMRVYLCNNYSLWWTWRKPHRKKNGSLWNVWSIDEVATADGIYREKKILWLTKEYQWLNRRIRKFLNTCKVRRARLIVSCATYPPAEFFLHWICIH